MASEQDTLRGNTIENQGYLFVYIYMYLDLIFVFALWSTSSHCTSTKQNLFIQQSRIIQANLFTLLY